MPALCLSPSPYQLGDFGLISVPLWAPPCLLMEESDTNPELPKDQDGSLREGFTGF